MRGHRALLVARTVLLPVVAGWLILLALSNFVERPLLLWTARLLGAHWIATAKLSFDCLTLAATGWALGRLNRPAPMLGVVIFAATLAVFGSYSSLGIDFSALISLAAAALHDVHLLGPLGTIGLQYLFLFGSLIVGGLLSRPPRRPLSLFSQRAKARD